MCQMRVYTEENGQEKILAEDVTLLEVSGKQIEVTSLFEGTKSFDGAIEKIDFNNGKLFLNLTT